MMAGMIVLTHSLALEVVAFGVAVNDVGPVPGCIKAGASMPAEREAARGRRLLRRPPVRGRGGLRVPRPERATSTVPSSSLMAATSMAATYCWRLRGYCRPESEHLARPRLGRTRSRQIRSTPRCTAACRPRAGLSEAGAGGAARCHYCGRRIPPQRALVDDVPQFADVYVVGGNAADDDRHMPRLARDASSIAKTLLRMHSAMAAARSSDTPRRQRPKYLAADTPDRAELPHRYSDHVRHRGQRNVAAVVTEGVVDLIEAVERADPLEFRTGR